MSGMILLKINHAFKQPNHRKHKIIIAKTTKGKGVSYMENELKWHYYIVTDEHRDKALRELDN